MNTEVDKMKQSVGALLQKGKKEEVNVEKSNDNNEPSDNNGTGAPSVSADADQTAQLSDREQWEMDKAIKSGWKPPSEWEGDQSDFIKPKQWNMNVAWQRKLDATQAENKRLREQTEKYGDRVENVMKVAKATAIAELESKKKEAIEDADHGEVKKIDKEIEDTHKEFDIEKPEPEPQPIRPEVQDWMEDNPWFENNEKMARYAVKFQRGQLATLPDGNNPTTQELEEALEVTTEAVKQKFPDEFRRKPRAVSQNLENGGTTRPKKNLNYSDLTKQEQTICDEMVRTKAMKKEDYIQAIADIRKQKGES